MMEGRISLIPPSETSTRNLGLSITLQLPTILRPAVKQKHPISRLRTFCKRPLLRWEGYGGTSCQTLYGPTVVQDSHWYVTLPDHLWENMSPTRRAGAPCTLGYPEVERGFKTRRRAQNEANLRIRGVQRQGLS